MRAIGRGAVLDSSLLVLTGELITSDDTARINIHQVFCVVVQIVSAEGARVPLGAMLFLLALHRGL